MSLHTTQFAHSHQLIAKQSSEMVFTADALTGHRSLTEQDREKAYLTQTLSHDINAYLMVLEFSFQYYNQLVQNIISSGTPKKSNTYNTLSDREEPDHRIIIAHGAEFVTGTPHTEKTTQLGNKHNRIPLNPQWKNIEQLSEIGEHVKACIGQMRQFVSELVTLAKTGNIDMQPTSVSLQEVVNEVIFEQQQMISDRNISIFVSSNLQSVYVNKMRLKQLVTNLIRNAMIHGCDPTEPVIRIKMISGEKNKSLDRKMVTFSINDNGKGIFVQDRVHIFEPGYRGTGNQNEGSGIGLALVKKIAQYYQGDVVLKVTRTGTTFVVTLPKAPSH